MPQEIKDSNGNIIGLKAAMTPTINGKDAIPDASNVNFIWHTHPNVKVGGIRLGNSTPSKADFNFQSFMQSQGLKWNGAVIGVGSGTVTFYNKEKIIMTIKYSDFKKMGGK